MSSAPQQSPEQVPEPPAELLAELLPELAPELLPELAPELLPELPPPLPPPLPVEPVADRRVGQAYLLLAISACLMLTLGVVIQLWSPYLGLVVDQTLLIFLPAVLYVRGKRLAVAEALGWRPISPATALLGVALGAGGFGVAVGIVLLSTPITGRGPDFEFFEFATLPQLALTLFCAALLPGICEETLFRGLVQAMLGRLGAVKAVLITSLLFALFHFNPWNFLPPLFLGVSFGILTLRTGSTVPAMIAHATNNALAFTIAYLFHDEYDPRAQIVCAALAAVWVVTFSIYLVKTSDQAPQPELLASAPAGLSSGQLAATVALTVIVVGLVFLVVLALLFAHHAPSHEPIWPPDGGDEVTLQPAAD